MPKPGQKTITVSKTIYNLAKNLAEKENKSVAGKVSEIIEGECDKKEDDV